MTPSYLELSPLYGNNQVEQDTMRTFRDGKIKPDCFSNKRILGFPPGVGMIACPYPYNQKVANPSRCYADHVQSLSYLHC